MPSLGRSQARLACEQQWLNSGLPVQSFRLPAIYGPGDREMLEDQGVHTKIVQAIRHAEEIFSRVE